MKRTTMACLAVTLAALVGTAARASDEQIATQIVQRLQQKQQMSKMEGFNVGVQVQQGTVTVMGTVSQTEDALLALDIARRVPGVKLVVNDLFVQPPGTGNQVAPASAQSPLAQTSPAIPGLPSSSLTGSEPPQANLPSQGPFSAGSATTIGAGGTASPQAARPSQQPLQVRPVSSAPASSLGPGLSAQAQPLPSARRSSADPRQKPVAFAPATRLMAQQASGQAAPEYQQAVPAQYAHPAGPAHPVGGSAGPVPVPMGMAGGGMVAQASYDNPQMPGYAWPSYAAYPNYAALTYPHQYSPTAWPYIGPFYPYPQVPLGWRKVTLEWDDGWWFLDFKSKTKH